MMITDEILMEIPSLNGIIISNLQMIHNLRHEHQLQFESITITQQILKQFLDPISSVFVTPALSVRESQIRHPGAPVAYTARVTEREESRTAISQTDS